MAKYYPFMILYNFFQIRPPNPKQVDLLHKILSHKNSVLEIILDTLNPRGTVSFMINTRVFSQNFWWGPSGTGSDEGDLKNLSAEAKNAPPQQI